MSYIQLYIIYIHEMKPKKAVTRGEHLQKQCISPSTWMLIPVAERPSAASSAGLLRAMTMSLYTSFMMVYVPTLYH